MSAKLPNPTHQYKMLYEQSPRYAGSRMVFKYLFLLLSVLLVVYLLHKTDKISHGEVTVFRRSAKLPKFFETWHSCVRTKFFDEKLTLKESWQQFARMSKECDKEAAIQENLHVAKLMNRDEAKFAIYPLGASVENIFVTLGIGLDITAEQEFQKQMMQRGHNVTFFGADPIVEGNSKLYSQIGTYFPYAVSGSAGFTKASVLLNGSYKWISVASIDIYYFLGEVLKKKFIDHLWMDAEYAEFELFDLFYRNGPLDKLNIEFCQMSLEVHQVGDDVKQNQFRTFIKRLIDERRYGFFLSEYVGHNRIWLFNMDSEACAHKYLGRSQ